MTDLQTIPGVGPRMAGDLLQLGYPSVESLRGADPETLYARICGLSGCTVDRCVLYVFRCAVYYASTASPEPEKCKWWYWKDHRP